MPIDEDQIQPASVDLRLGNVAHRVQASFLPGAETVAEKLEQFGLHALDTTGGAVLERGCVYIVPLCESLRLERGLSGHRQPEKLDRPSGYFHPPHYRSAALSSTVSARAMTGRFMPKFHHVHSALWCGRARG